MGLEREPVRLWLAERGMNTLELRVARANANASALADFLAGQPRSGVCSIPAVPIIPIMLSPAAA